MISNKKNFFFVILCAFFMKSCQNKFNSTNHENSKVLYFEDFDFFKLEGKSPLNYSDLKYPMIRLINKDTIKSITFYFNHKTLISLDLLKKGDYWLQINEEQNTPNGTRDITKYKDGKLYTVHLSEKDNTVLIALSLTSFNSNTITYSSFVLKNFIEYDPLIEPWDIDTSQLRRKTIDTYSIQNSKFKLNSKTIATEKPDYIINACHKYYKIPLIYYFYFYENFIRVEC